MATVVGNGYNCREDNSVKNTLPSFRTGVTVTGKNSLPMDWCEETKQEVTKVKKKSENLPSVSSAVNVV